MGQGNCIHKEGNLYIRQELNGLSVFDQEKGSYRFYPHSADDPEEYPQLSFPVRINWMITDQCNLDCIYCIASDKMAPHTRNSDPLATAGHILSLHPLTVTLSGGEPLLCRDLLPIIDSFSGKTGLLLDTNGTVPFSREIIESCRRADVSVRISLDSADPGTACRLRPYRYSDKDMLPVIMQNLQILLAEDIHVRVHTVLSTINLPEITRLGETLSRLGVKYWHIYSLRNTGRARNIYSGLHVPGPEHVQLLSMLRSRFPDIYISGESGGCTAALMADSTGRFFAETDDSSPVYIGPDPKKPAPEEIRAGMNWDTYLKYYYSNTILS